jgi:hypothetical protein
VELVGVPASQVGASSSGFADSAATSIASSAMAMITVTAS